MQPGGRRHHTFSIGAKLNISWNPPGSQMWVYHRASALRKFLTMQKQNKILVQVAPLTPFLFSAALRFKPASPLRIPVPSPIRFKLVQPRIAKAVAC
jgi:hypothetical protein